LEPAEFDQPDHGKLLLSVFVLIVLVLIAGTFFWSQGKKGVKTAATPPAAPAQRSQIANHYIAPLEQAKAVADKVSKQNLEGEAAVDAFSSPQKPVQSAGLPRTAIVNSGTPPQAQAAARVPSSGAASVRPVPVSHATEPQLATARDFPELKLNAIYYRLRGPTVVINGKTLKTGEEIDGAKVTEIQRSSVELEFNGRKKALSLR
jgi:hypothetical protein